MATESSTQGFKIEDLVVALQKCAQSKALIDFAGAMDEVAKVFQTLGGAFSFAQGDLDEKRNSLRYFGSKKYASIQEAVVAEASKGNIPPKNDEKKGVLSEEDKAGGANVRGDSD